ncbi:unnamed protein product [Lupinus luteus]|uniref:Protein EARLY FLOWERING 4 domain-containing protein n=1 Tax=Lupinus luteus TaxID=3873 RepID=A0AAV1WMU2_LUPLU
MEGDTSSGLGNGTKIDSKVEHTFHNSFVQVQNILDQNRVLINEINQNHESKVPYNLSRNVGLIRELNNTIRRVFDLVSVDSLIEEVPTVEPLNEYVQSCDVIAFNTIQTHSLEMKIMPLGKLQVFDIMSACVVKDLAVGQDDAYVYRHTLFNRGIPGHNRSSIPELWSLISTIDPSCSLFRV